MSRGPVSIRPVQSRRDLAEFIDFPWQVYADDPYWVAPLRSEVKAFLNPAKHPFYRFGAAQTFLAVRDGRAVGRILASDDPHFNAEHGTNLGTFGMFECLDDPQAAHVLLDAAAGWSRNRGRNAIWGPVDYSTNYPCGLLIDGFHSPPRIMMNHHPAYYRGLLESWGLAKSKDLYGWWFIDADDMLDKWSAKADRLARRGSILVRPIRVQDFAAEVKKLEAIYNQAWERNWGFVKMTREEFSHLSAMLTQILVPEVMLLAEVDGQPVGFSMTLPDVNEAIRPLNGRLWKWGLPIGAWQLYRGLKKIKTCRLLTLGVLPEFRRRGVTELLILKTLDHGKNKVRYTAAELSWTLEDNTLINNAIEAVGATRYKTYRIFEKPLA